ncbi:MAG: DUF4055 domain-containing protein [Smithella sp.]|nr:DUF4055 domain-containing protein [Smithella sp.]
MASIVDTEHPQYSKMSARWKRCRDAAEGTDAIKAAGVLYLPKLTDQTDSDYNAYKLRASFFNASWKTINALSGMMFRKPPQIKVTASIALLLDDITMDGRSLHILAQQAAIEILTSGRIGVLVDYPQESAAGKTLADAQNLNLRPSMQFYFTESIINWKTARIQNKRKLSLAVLTEDVDIPDNEFEHKKEIRYRVLDLFNGIYRQRIFRINEKKEDEQISPDIFPLMNGRPLDYIPLYIIGVDDTTPDIDAPPLIDLVDMNLAHYRTNADYAHGLHFSGMPTAIVTGYTPHNVGDKLYVGSSSAWVFPDSQAKAFFLEFTGQGLSAIERAIERMEQQMAILGARLLTSEKRATETAQTAQIHRAGESSILASIAQTISIGLTEALKTFSKWAGVKDPDAAININRDFMPIEMDAQTLTALVASWQAGAISMESLFDQLKQGEIIRDDITFEEEQERIASAPIPRPEIDENE